MKTRLLAPMTIPFVAFSLLPLLGGIWAAWNVHRSQKETAKALAINVAGMRAAEELAIGLRDVRTQLLLFLVKRDAIYLKNVAKLRHETDPWLAATERTAITQREQQLIAEVQQGYRRFFDEFEQLRLNPGTDLSPKVRDLINRLDSFLDPAQAYLDVNEKEIDDNNKQTQEMTGRIVVGLVLLGVCGPLSGLLVGFGIARGISRSIGRLSVPIRDTAGKLNEIVGPITLSARWDLEEMEAVLQTLAERTGAVVEQLQQSQREVLRVEQLAVVGRMAAGLAHELRNPLMPMKILVQSAAEHQPEPCLMGQDLVVLEQEIDRLEHSIQTFLDFARPPDPEKRLFDLAGLVRQVAALLAARAEHQGIRLECHLPDKPALVLADAGQLRQLVLNLLLNALDAVALSEPRTQRSGVSGCGTVTVDLEQATEGQGLVLRVADTGPGLPATLGERIFDAFVSTREAGLGLGLTICKRIVEAHDGTITAANRPQGGATFTVRFPARGVHGDTAGDR